MPPRSREVAPLLSPHRHTLGPVDISAFAYCCMRAIGGSWTEKLPGTPHHVVMSCPAMLPLVNLSPP